MNIRLILVGLVASAALCGIPGTAPAQIFVADSNLNTIGEYNATTGAPVNFALVSGLSDPEGIALSGGNLFVANSNIGTIGEYDATTGAPVNPTLVSGLALPQGIALSGGNLFVSNGSGTIGEYNATTGAPVNPTLVSGLSRPGGIVLSGGNLFVTNEISGGGWIGEYNATTGAPVNPTLVSGLNVPVDIALSGGDLFVANLISRTIGEYNATTGAPVNPTLVSTLSGPGGIVVVSASVPDRSSTWALLLLALTATFGLQPLLRRPASTGRRGSRFYSTGSDFLDNKQRTKISHQSPKSTDPQPLAFAPNRILRFKSLSALSQSANKSANLVREVEEALSERRNIPAVWRF
jgi:hypothetical protein